MNAELEKLAARPWQVVAKLSNIPNGAKAPLGELMEAYIRNAWHAGYRAALQDLVDK